MPNVSTGSARDEPDPPGTGAVTADRPPVTGDGHQVAPPSVDTSTVGDRSPDRSAAPRPGERPAGGRPAGGRPSRPRTGS
ncbi:hypothetical protein [Streptomyces sp. NPDC101115]|uniref:hypothetical protein n=1 Tax=Streptomyces sp. NPDC101115 TaxID=3366106 RepID=UPI00380FA589